MATKIRSKKNTMKNTGGMLQWQGLAAPKNVQTKPNQTVKTFNTDNYKKLTLPIRKKS